MKDMDTLTLAAYILVLIGGLNWGLLGLTNVNFLQAIVGELLGRLLFIIVGVSAGYLCYQFYLMKFKKA